MCKWFKEMDCYILAGNRQTSEDDLRQKGDLTQLERGFRNYAAIFSKVKLVIKKEQAREQYLNYPYVCDGKPETSPLVGVATALHDASSEAVFIGSSKITNFPLRLLYELVKNYRGETFAGYYDQRKDNRQLLFGIYRKEAAKRIDLSQLENGTIEDLLDDNIKLMPLPEDVDASCIGMN